MSRSLLLAALVGVLASPAAGQTCRSLYSGQNEFTTIYTTADSVAYTGVWTVRRETMPARTVVEVDHLTVSSPGKRLVTIAMQPSVRATAPRGPFPAIVKHYLRLWCEQVPRAIIPLQLARVTTT